MARKKLPFTASPNRRRFTREQRQELEEYVRYYTERGIHGVWQEHAQAIDGALREIDRLKRRARKATP